MNDELFLNTLVAKAVNQTAKQVAKSQREYIAEDDLRQEAWIWVFAHTEKVNGWLDDDETASQKNARGLLSSSLRVHLHKICQKPNVCAVTVRPRVTTTTTRATWWSSYYPTHSIQTPALRP